MSLPRALDPFIRFAQALRGAGFAVSPDQTTDFIAAVGILGPNDMTDIYRSGRALFGVQPGGRLIYYYDFGIVNEGLGNPQPALHTT